MIRSINRVDVSQIDGKDLGVGDGMVIEVESHQTWTKHVVLEVDGKRFAVEAEDMIVAIKNATNVNRHG